MAFVSADIPEMLAHQLGAFEIMVLKDELIEAPQFVRLDGPDGKLLEHVLFISRGLAVANFIFCHGPQSKKSSRPCPVKSLNPPRLRKFASCGYAP